MQACLYLTPSPCACRPGEYLPTKYDDDLVWMHDFGAACMVSLGLKHFLCGKSVCQCTAISCDDALTQQNNYTAYALMLAEWCLQLGDILAHLRSTSWKPEGKSGLKD